MQAGRELDALVAVKVMGWFPVAGGWRIQNGQVRTWEEVSGAPGFKPSTEIVAAWQVVERMRALGYVLHLHYLLPPHKASVSFRHPDGDVDMYWEDDLEVPQAVCQAALKVIKVGA